MTEFSSAIKQSNLNMKKRLFILTLVALIYGFDSEAAELADVKVSKAQANAEVVIKVIEGLSKWVDDNRSDLQVAALASAWGEHCLPITNQGNDSGVFNAGPIDKTAANDCANAEAYAYVFESILGAWAANRFVNTCDAKLEPLHPATLNDEHDAKSFAKAKLDERVEASSVGVLNSVESLNSRQISGEVLVEIKIDSLLLSLENVASPLSSKWHIQVEVDSNLVFYSDCSLDQDGVVAVNGDIPLALFSITNSGDLWSLSLNNFVVEFPIDTLQNIGDSVIYAVRVDSEVEANAHEGCCVGNRGDVNGDGTNANILDLTFLVNRIFRSGPAPACLDEADINGDGTSSNILDLTFLVNYIFRGGALPGPCPL